jgi:hypothetical protein
LRLGTSLFQKNAIELYNFDRCTGTLSDLTFYQLPLTYFPYGLEFSGRHIYVSTSASSSVSYNSLLQIEVDSSNAVIADTLLFLDTLNHISMGQLQLAPDGKIYLSTCFYINDSSNFFTQNLGIINYPNITGAGCDFHPYSFFLGDSAISYGGLPNIPNYNLLSTTIYQTDAGVDTFWCLGDTTKKGVTIGSLAIPGVIYKWQPEEDIDSINQAQQYVSPSQSTLYYLTITDTTIQGSCQSRTDSVYVEVRICTGIQSEEQSESEVKVYPNPANEQLIIEITEHVDFLLYDIMGRQVIKQALQAAKIVVDISTLPEGLYIYRIGNHAGKVQVVR